MIRWAKFPAQMITIKPWPQPLTCSLLAGTLAHKSPHCHDKYHTVARVTGSWDTSDRYIKHYNTTWSVICKHQSFFAIVVEENLWDWKPLLIIVDVDLNRYFRICWITNSFITVVFESLQHVRPICPKFNVQTKANPLGPIRWHRVQKRAVVVIS